MRESVDQKLERLARSERMTAIVKVTEVVGFPVVIALMGYVCTSVLGRVEAGERRQESFETRLQSNELSYASQLSEVSRQAERGLAMLSERLVSIEASRFKSSDALALQETISQLWREVTDRAKRDEVPPQWFKDQVDKIDADLKALRDRVERLHDGKGS